MSIAQFFYQKQKSRIYTLISIINEVIPAKFTFIDLQIDKFISTYTS